jgi:hypothetical protein
MRGRKRREEKKEKRGGGEKERNKEEKQLSQLGKSRYSGLRRRCPNLFPEWTDLILYYPPSTLSIRLP